MVKIFEIILLSYVLYLVYLSLKKYKKECDSYQQPEIYEQYVETTNLDYDKNNKDEYKGPNFIKFNYEKQKIKDKELLKEQGQKVNLKTWYPNTWIEKIDKNGKPIYNSIENITGSKEDFIESKARFTYKFNSPRSVHMDGISDPNDFKDGKGRTLKEVYDNSIVDYKKMIPEKQMISTDPDKLNIRSGGSNLSSIIPDNWIYNEEKPENGGIFENGLMGDDPYSSNSISNSLAIIDY